MQATITVEEAARKLGIKPRTVHYLIKAGELTGQRVGRRMEVVTQGGRLFPKHSGKAAKTEYLTPEEAAKRLGVHTDTVLRWVKDGKVQGVKFGHRSVRIIVSDGKILHGAHHVVT